MPEVESCYIFSIAYSIQSRGHYSLGNNIDKKDGNLHFDSLDTLSAVEHSPFDWKRGDVGNHMIDL